ncbi:Threonine aspartase 1 [Blattella germanica]|nr:Threonine aspartase 1 [Blattella germanica]
MSGFIGVHLGAGQHSEKHWQDYKRLCHKTCKKAYSDLREGVTALEVVTMATAALEDSPITNAGFGSNLTWDGNVECDASVMDGNTLHFGAVGAAPGIKNPVRLAHNICKKQRDVTLALGRLPPCLLVGYGARKWAEQAGIPTVEPEALVSERALKQFNHYKKKVEIYEAHVNKVLSPLDTVGAVCVDSYGNLAASCSSGGVALKHPGRAATFGCGCWAQNGDDDTPGIAACTSGNGEYLVRTTLAREVALDMQRSNFAATGLHAAMKNKFIESPFLRGIEEKLGGIIVVKWMGNTNSGEFLWAHSSKTMCISYMCDGLQKPAVRLSQLPREGRLGTSLVVEGAPFKVNAQNGT